MHVSHGQCVRVGSSELTALRFINIFGLWVFLSNTFIACLILSGVPCGRSLHYWDCSIGTIMVGNHYLAQLKYLEKTKQPNLFEFRSVRNTLLLCQLKENDRFHFHVNK